MASSEEDLLEEITRLRAQLAARDALVRRAGEALLRDSAEVVRVVAELERKDAALKEDLQLALRFQSAMIEPLPEGGEPQVDALYLPAEIISGDFYDVARLDAGVTRIFIADATGHGIAAGLVTMFIKSEYEAAKRSTEGPARMLRALNDRLTSRYENLSLRFTALCVDIDPGARRLRYGAAAHPAPLVVHGGVAQTLETGGTFVGMARDVDFPEYTVDFVAGDVGAVFTDGLLDAAFDETRIGAILASASPRGVCSRIVTALGDLVGAGNALSDDVTFVTFRLSS
jgi:serine phosphatase RsbU (regulator of sigma subunit)